MALAYPNSGDTKLREIIARDAFLSALADRDLEIRVRDREPPDLDTAFRAAMRIESYVKSTGSENDREGRATRDRMDGHRARHVQTRDDVVQGDMQAAMRDLKDQLHRSMKLQEELSKEVGRMRVLAEQRAESDRRAAAAPETRQDTKTSVDRPEPNTRDARGSNRGCYRCGDESHFARNCPNRRPGKPGVDGC